MNTLKFVYVEIRCLTYPKLKAVHIVLNYSDGFSNLTTTLELYQIFSVLHLTIINSIVMPLKPRSNPEQLLVAPMKSFWNIDPWT